MRLWQPRGGTHSKVPCPCDVSQQKNQNQSSWAQDYLTEFPSELEVTIFLQTVKTLWLQGHVCLVVWLVPGKYARTLCCPNPMVGFVQAAIFLVFILWPFHAYVHNRSCSSSHIPLFPHCWTPSVLLKSPSCFHVLLLVCGTLSWGLLAWARVEGFFFFFFWRALETCQCSSSQESSTPHPPATIRCPYFSFSPGPGALHQ